VGVAVGTDGELTMVVGRGRVPEVVGVGVVGPDLIAAAVRVKRGLMMALMVCCCCVGLSWFRGLLKAGFSIIKNSGPARIRVARRIRGFTLINPLFNVIAAGGHFVSHFIYFIGSKRWRKVLTNRTSRAIASKLRK